MPITKSAKKSLRVSEKRRGENLTISRNFKIILKKLAKAKDKGKLISESFSAIDKAVKKNVLHRNKAARLKSALSNRFKLVKNEPLTKTENKKTKVKKITTSKNKK